MYYRPFESAVAADVIPFFANGKFMLFYLRDYRNIEKHGEGCPWCLLETKDLVHYSDLGEVLLRGKEEEQDLYVFTGCCVKFNNEYRIYYTGHNPHLRQKGLPEQKILMAKSSDLVHWEKDKNFVFEAPSWLEMHDFRDPFVFFDEDTKKWAMLLAGRKKNESPFFTKGVTLIAYSEDGINWDVSKEHFYEPNAYFTHECPDLFKIGEWYYLIFSEFTDKVCTKYVMSKSLKGPWHAPKVDSFDGHAYYAAKSTSDGNRRILFGWNPIKDKEIDNNPWQWGGTIIPHEIYQDKTTNELYVKCPKEIDENFSKELKITKKAEFGKVFDENNIIKLDDKGRNIVLFNELPESCKLCFDIKLEDRGEAGVYLRGAENLDTYYSVKFERKFNRIAFDRLPRKENTTHTEIDVERYIDYKEVNNIKIIIEGTVLVTYINDKYAMTTRMFDHKKGLFGFYSINNKVEISNIKLFGTK